MSTNDTSRKKEGEYFAKIEFERKQEALLAKQKRLDEDAKKKARDVHWMHCPKFGLTMVEVDFEGIKVDKCSKCLGIFFDNGEVDHLVEKNKPGFLRRLNSLFQD